MNKPLVLTCSLLCLAVIAVSAVTYFQSSVFTDKMTQNLVSTENTALVSSDWQAVLNELPQYKVSKTQDAQPIATQNKSIDDGLLIAIIADSPRAILILEGTEQITPTKLAEGEGWLDNWVIKSILPDKVEWTNTATSDTYTQYLFKTADTETDNS